MAAKNAISVPAAAKIGAKGTLRGICRSLSGHGASGGGRQWIGVGLFGQDTVDYFGKIALLEGVNLGFDGRYIVGGEHGHAGLKNNLAGVKFFVDVVDRNAGFGVAIALHGFVNMVPVHSFSAVEGQEGGMNIDDFLRVGHD